MTRDNHDLHCRHWSFSGHEFILKVVKPAPHTTVYTFGEYRVDPAERTLSRHSEAVSLRPKSFDVLVELVRNHGRLVERRSLLDEVWADASVEENSLSKAVADIRKALGERARQNRFIETVAKRGYRFVAAVTDDSETTSAAASNDRISAVAVLPFEWLTQAGSDGSLSVGLADAVITRLSNLPQIIVRPTSSILRYQNAAQDPLEAADELKVDYVISGNLQLVDDRVRVTVQMVSPRQRRSVWAEHFEEAFTHLFAVEDSISARVATGLALKLTRAQRENLMHHSTENRDAYQLYLRGRYLWNVQTYSSAQKAIESFREAIELDPHYALAWAGIADSYILIGLSGALTGGMAPNDIYPEATHAAARAIELDESLPDAHTALGFIQTFYEWQREAARESFQRAILLQPHYASAHHGLALLMGFHGRHQEAMEAMNAALESHPLSLILNANKGYLLYAARRYDESLEILLKTIEIGPSFAPLHYRAALTWAAKENSKEAIRHLDEVQRLSESGVHAMGALGHLFGRTGREAEARDMLRQLVEASSRRYVSPVLMAEVCTGLGQLQEAIDWLERALLDRSAALLTCNVDPRFDALRTDPRFQQVMHKVIGNDSRGVDKAFKTAIVSQ